MIGAIHNKAESILDSLYEDALGNPEGHCDDCEHVLRHSESYEFWGAKGHTEFYECSGPEPKECPYVVEVVDELYRMVYEQVKKEAAP